MKIDPHLKLCSTNQVVMLHLLCPSTSASYHSTIKKRQKLKVYAFQSYGWGVSFSEASPYNHHAVGHLVSDPVFSGTDKMATQHFPSDASDAYRKLSVSTGHSLFTMPLLC